MTRGLESCTSQYLGSKERSCELQLANNDRASLRILARELQAESPHDVADDRSAASYCGIASERRPLSGHQVLLQIEALLTPSLLGRNAMTGGGLAFARIREMFIRGHRGAWPAGPWAAHLNLHGCMHYICVSCTQTRVFGSVHVATHQSTDVQVNSRLPSYGPLAVSADGWEV